jgi:hypothetical protein
VGGTWRPRLAARRSLTGRRDFPHSSRVSGHGPHRLLAASTLRRSRRRADRRHGTHLAYSRPEGGQQRLVIDGRDAPVRPRKEPFDVTSARTRAAGSSPSTPRRGRLQPGRRHGARAAGRRRGAPRPQGGGAERLAREGGLRDPDPGRDRSCSPGWTAAGPGSSRLPSGRGCYDRCRLLGVYETELAGGVLAFTTDERRRRRRARGLWFARVGRKAAAARERGHLGQPGHRPVRAAGLVAVGDRRTEPRRRRGLLLPRRPGVALARDEQQATVPDARTRTSTRGRSSASSRASRSRQGRVHLRVRRRRGQRARHRCRLPARAHDARLADTLTLSPARSQDRRLTAALRSGRAGRPRPESHRHRRVGRPRPAAPRDDLPTPPRRPTTACSSVRAAGLNRRPQDRRATGRRLHRFARLGWRRGWRGGRAAGRFAPGDEVLATTAARVHIGTSPSTDRAEHWTHKPAGSPSRRPGAPAAGPHRRAGARGRRPARGETLAVTGGSGGVGHLAVQWACAAGGACDRERLGAQPRLRALPRRRAVARDALPRGEAERRLDCSATRPRSTRSSPAGAT